MKSIEFTGMSNIASEALSGRESVGNRVIHYIDTTLVIPSFEWRGQMTWTSKNKPQIVRELQLKSQKSLAIEYQLTYNLATKKVNVRTFRVHDEFEGTFDASFKCEDNEKQFCDALSKYLKSNAVFDMVSERLAFQIRNMMNGMALS